MQKEKYTRYQRWARHLIAGYPACWRHRYAEEMLQILEDSPLSLKTILNLVMSLIDAYFHQYLMKERVPYMLQRTRFNALVIYGATLIFFVPWIFVREHFIDFANHVVFPSLSFTDPLSATITHSISYLLLIFMLLGGLPILLAACWQALKERKLLTLLFCLLGLISPVVTGIIALTFTSLGLFLPFSIVIGLGLSLALITFSVQRVAPSQRVTHYALSLATAIPLVMLLGLATLMLKVIPSLFTLFVAGGSLFYILREDLLILLMGGTLVLILVSLKKGFDAKRVMQNSLS